MNKVKQHVRKYLTKCLIFSKCLIMYAKEKSRENREKEGVKLLHWNLWKLHCSLEYGF